MIGGTEWENDPPYPDSIATNAAALMLGFINESDHNLDEKGRLVIPQRHRAAFASGFVLTRGLDGCLWLWPLPTFESVQEQIRPASILDEPTRNLERLLYTGLDGKLDQQGRLTIPASLRKYAGIGSDGQVVLLGSRRRLEVWSPERWDAVTQRLPADAASASEQIRVTLM